MLPDSLEVCGLPYTVALRPMTDGAGACNTGRLEIVVDSDTAPAYQQSTLLHEVLEVINAAHAMKLRHSQIATLETELFAVLRNNPAWW